MIVLYRGHFILAPGVSLRKCTAGGLNFNVTSGMLTISSTFSGGALLQLIFALGVMPYITASIIQLLQRIVPRFQELHDFTQYTRCLTTLALLNATTIVLDGAARRLLGNCPGIIPL